MNDDKVSRREFLGVGAAIAGVSLVGEKPGIIPILLEEPRHAAPRANVRFGIVGVGMQGNSLLSESIRLDGVECVAACDLYDGRHVLAREIVRPDLPVTRRYQELLSNPNVDALIVAVPDHWHRQIVVDAVNAGKDVYCEKPMSHSAADGVAMVEAARRTGRIVQVGSQRVSSVICAKARDLIASGILGEPMYVEAWLGRNSPSGAWQYPPPPDLSPATLDWNTWLGTAPKIPFNPEVFARWRAWKEYGTGVAGDLLVHLMSGFLFMSGINKAPTRTQSVGGIRRWKDGRNTPDVHLVLYDYDGLPVNMRLNLGTAMQEGYRFHGSKGLLEVGSGSITFTPQSGKDTGPSWYVSSFPRAMREEVQRKWREQNALKPGMQEPVTEVMSFRGPGYDDVKPHLWNFFEAVRNRTPVVEDAVFGHHAALACHLANESYYKRAAV
ncbi:MAG: Gfo/Idh/MocA family protein [Gemmatimonadaceae bacterium]